MFSRLRDFVTRHRRKFIVTGVIVGGTFIAIKYAQRKLLEFQERQARDFLDKTRRMQHFECTERTCNQVILGMGVELYQAILRECNTEALLTQLRQNPSNKLELWEEMKIVAFTRLTTFIYASSMLTITLRIQLNLLGGYLYRDITTEQKKITDELKQEYLSLIQHFIHKEDGLRALVQLIRSKVLAIMQQLPLTKRLSLADLEQLFWSLQMSINSDAAGDPISHMIKYLLPPQAPQYGAQAPLLEKMYNETLDLLESDDAANVASNNVCRGFSLAVDAVAENLGETIQVAQQQDTNPKPAGESSKSAGDVAEQPLQQQQQKYSTIIVPSTFTSMPSNSNTNANGILNINSIEVALAKIIPIVSGITSKGFDSTSRPQNLATSLLTFYVVSEKSKVLGANVYETFSST